MPRSNPISHQNTTIKIEPIHAADRKYPSSSHTERKI